MKPIALQLYTVRELCQEDFPGTVKRVAEVGYKGVEFAGLHGMAPSEVKALVNDLGLEVASSHVALLTAENAEEVIEQERTLGNRRLVTSMGQNQLQTLDDCKRAAASLQQAADMAKQAGMEFGYHNHWWEFLPVEGQLPHEILMSEAPDAFAQLDVYWVAYGKADPVQVVRRYKDRAPLLHMKDGTLEEGAPHTAVGAGALDMPAIVGATDESVTDWLIVELDHCATDMFQAVVDSYTYLTENGLAEGSK
ncbi:MAG: sugar phosphate isomerase/epimerase family protein [Armatimonadota bacterium]